MKSVRHVACMGETRNANNILVEKRERKSPLGRLVIGGAVMLKWILKLWDV
jgi:hypothetical protein